jgi:hypothetical protein
MPPARSSNHTGPMPTMADIPPRRLGFLPDTPRAWPRGRLNEVTYILGDLGLSIARFASWVFIAVARLLFTLLQLLARGVGVVVGKISGDRVKQRVGEIIGWVLVIVILVSTISSLSITRTWFAQHWPHPAAQTMRPFVPSGPCRQVRTACTAPTRSLDGAPSLSANTILSVLQSYNSPAANSTFANQLYDLGLKYNINPAYALGFFAFESQCGSAGVATHTDSLGNVRFTQSASPVGYGNYNGYRKYSSWRDGAEDWYWVVRTFYINKGLNDIFKIIPIYAPSTDNNDPQLYAQTVYQLVQKWGN